MRLMTGMKRPSGEGAGLFPSEWGTTSFHPVLVLHVQSWPPVGVSLNMLI